MNLIDFSAMAKEWASEVDMSPDVYPVIGDGVIDLRDLAVIASYWLSENTH